MIDQVSTIVNGFLKAADAAIGLYKDQRLIDYGKTKEELRSLKNLTGLVAELVADGREARRVARREFRESGGKIEDKYQRD